MEAEGKEGSASVTKRERQNLHRKLDLAIDNPRAMIYVKMLADILTATTPQPSRPKAQKPTGRWMAYSGRPKSRRYRELLARVDSLFRHPRRNASEISKVEATVEDAVRSAVAKGTVSSVKGLVPIKEKRAKPVPS